jgi:amino acid permease
MPILYLIATAWVYVVMLMALTENSVVAGVLTFFFYCLVPLFLVFYLALSSSRKRQRLRKINADRTNAENNMNNNTSNDLSANAVDRQSDQGIKSDSGNPD